MQSTDIWTQAWASVLPAWETNLRHAGWHPVLATAAAAALALLCLARAYADRSTCDDRLIWCVAGSALLLQAINTLFAFDLLLIGLARAAARASGCYEGRRAVQVLVLGALVAAAGGAWCRWHHHLALMSPSTHWLVSGLVVLASLAALRLVSLHATDAVINTRLAGLTVGSLIAALGLGLVAVGLWCDLRPAGA